MEVRSFFVLLLAFAVCCTVCQSQSIFRFSENSYTGYEGTGYARVRIERTGDTDQSGTIRVTTFASTASAGGDYTSLNLVVDFNENEVSQFVDVDLIQDNQDDDEETFTVRLSDPTGGTLGSPSDAVVEIRDGAAPSSSSDLPFEVLIAIIVACVAAVLILLICCLLIYCLRFRRVREDVVYIQKPRPEPIPEPLPEPYPEPFIPGPRLSYTPPPQRRPYTPPLRPRTPPPAEQPNTQVMVINEPSPPIIEPPPPKPTQVIVIRPQTPEIIRRRPEPTGPTEVVVSRRRPRSPSPVCRIIEEPGEPPFFEDRPPSPVTVVRRIIRKPVPVRDGDRFDDRDRFDDNRDRFDRDRFDDNRDRFDRGRFDRDRFDRDRFGGRDPLLDLQPGLGLPSLGRSPFGPQLPLSSSAFGSPLSTPAFGPASFGSTFPPAALRPSLGLPAAFGPQPPAAFGLQPPAAFGLQPSASFGLQPSASFGLQPPPAFGLQPPPAFGPQLPPSGLYGSSRF